MTQTINIEAVNKFYLAVTELANSGTVTGSYANDLVESVLADLGVDYEDFLTE